MVDYLLGGGERGSPYREDLQTFPKYLELTSSIQQYRLNSLRVVVSYERESGTEIGNFGEIRFRQQVFIPVVELKQSIPRLFHSHLRTAQTVWETV